MKEAMQVMNWTYWVVIMAAGALMSLVLLRAIAGGAVSAAEVMVEDRRLEEAKRKADNAAAEAAGKEASLEPLSLNPDGTIEEPILALVENS